MRKLSFFNQNLNYVFRYTADSNGYNAQVTYLEGEVQGDYAIQSTQSPSLAPALASAQPIYNYYKTLQEQQIQHNHLNYNDDDYTDNRVYNHYNTYPSTTPTPYYAHSQPTPVVTHYRNNVQNVDIKTYNTAPHEDERDVSLANQQVIIYPTTPAPYTDVHVLPTPRTLAYSTSSPYRQNNVVSSKSTNVLPRYHYYLDYDYRNANDGRASQSQNSYVASNSALYYKAKK